MRFLLVWLFLLLSWTASTDLCAQTSAPPAAPLPVKRPVVIPPPPIPPPLLLSSVDTFRRLLAMSPAQRAEELAKRSPAKRAILESKIQEFEQLSPQQREERLRALKLRGMLRHLIRLPSSNRLDQLVALPAADRTFVEARLHEWDQMPPDLQHAVLENEWAIRILVQSENTSLAHPATPPAHTQLEQSLERWRALPQEKRQDILGYFQRFFDDLTLSERASLLRDADAQEREQMEKTLQVFQQMSKPRRDQCLTNFQKLAALPASERHQFLINAALWDQMSPQERETWRKLVLRFSTRPPLPPIPLPTRKGSPLVTNPPP